MSELFNKRSERTKREFEKIFRGSRKLPYAHEKVCDENERMKQEKKRRARKNVLVEGSSL